MASSMTTPPVTPQETPHGRSHRPVRAGRGRLEEPARQARQHDAAEALCPLQAGHHRRCRRQAAGLRRHGRSRQVGCLERPGRQVEGRGDDGVRRPRRIAQVAGFAFFVFAAALVAAALAASSPSSSSSLASISLSMRLPNTPSSRPSWAVRSKVLAVTSSLPSRPERVNSTTSLSLPSMTVHSTPNFSSAASAHFQAILRALARPRE